MRAIWVRWGDEEWAGVYDDVDVIQLPLCADPTAEQLRNGNSPSGASQA